MTAGRRRPGVVAFLLCAAVGAGFALGLASVLTIGVGVLAVTALVAVLLARTRPPGPAWFGLLPGASLVPLYLAWLNRDGPGTVCTRTAVSESCTGEATPWPFVAVAVGLAAAGLVPYLVSRRRAG